jgi:signal peptidase I
LTIFGVGVGHLYCGRLARGLLFLAATLIGVPALVASTIVQPSDTLFWALCALVLASPVVTLIATVDAWRIARQSIAGSEPRAFQRPAVYALSMATVLVFSWTVALVMKRSLIEAFVIPSASMEPTLHNGDRFLVNKLRFALHPVERGDVVMYHSTSDHRMYVKRVIGLPGDVVEGRGGRVLVNHEPLPLEPADADRGTERERIGGRTHLVRPGGDFAETTVPDGAYFLLGDNRSASRDSRHVGPIAATDVGGRVEYVFFVRDDWHRVGALDR